MRVVRSSIRIHTFAEGLFARLAHDLELVCRDVTGSADAEKATLAVPIDRIDVAGVLKDGRVDAGILSASDREDIVGKMKREVFHARAGDVVTIEATAERVRVIPPHGAPAACALKTPPATDADGTLRVKGTLDVSLRAIGSDPVKGPMNAFRVKDRVEVLFDVVFAAEAVNQPA